MEITVIPRWWHRKEFKVLASPSGYKWVFDNGVIVPPDVLLIVEGENGIEVCVPEHIYLGH